MTISFLEIPANLRTPGAVSEVDPSKARQGPAVQDYHVLVIGQRLATGTVAELIPKLCTSAAQAADFFGANSMLHHMVEAMFRVNPSVTKITAVAQDDAGAAVAATSALVASGTATEAGTIHLYVAGREVQVAVASGDASTDVAAAINTAVGAATDLPVTGGVVSSTVTLTARNAGEEGNELDVRHSYFAGQKLPAGIGLTTPAFSGGSGNPDVAAVWAVLGEVHYHVMAVGYSDASTITKLNTELADRFGPLRHIQGSAIITRDDTHANLITYGDAQNTEHVTAIARYLAPHPPWEWSAVVAGIVGRYGQTDPAQPFQRRVMSGMLAPADADLFTRSERDLLLKDGMATFTVDAGGEVLIERLTTMYQTAAGGVPDTAWLDLNTMLTVGYIRWDITRRFETKYPNYKLADDSTQIGSGQKVVTPSIARSEILAAFRSWEQLGLVEDVDQFKTDLVVERNGGDPNRLDVLLPPDLVNQLRVTAIQVQFRV